ncbi:MAG: sulfurtransferase [Burkholderiales bacterium]|nr:sulfurtransferase [Burkholderiales bacterium]
MTYTTLISADALKNFHGELRIFDCSADLSQPHAGREQFEAQHIAGAGFADINTDLSSHDPALAVNGGRHPLPLREHFAAWLGRMGVGHHTQVVVYDRQGMNFCGRLWWMLQWCGHEAVAVLDGGLQAWVAVGGQVESGASVAAPARVFELRPSLVTLLHTSDVYAALGKPTQTILDARAPARFRGETEPFDPVAGHIPGALNRPFNSNIGPDGLMKSAAQLRTEFDTLLAGHAPASVVHHCGSGISAIPNLLAMQIAGLGSTALYAGSWSEWCNTPGLPCAQA